MLANIGPYIKHPDTSERNVAIHIDKYDVWNLDKTLSLIMLPAFRLFKETLHGWPAVLNSSEEWDIILDKIIRAHELLLDEKSEEYLYGDNPLNLEVEEGLELMSKYWRYFWT